VMMVNMVLVWKW